MGCAQPIWNLSNEVSVQYCLVKKNSWYRIARLIDGIPSFPHAIVAGSLFDAPNISFATTRYSSMAGQYAIDPFLHALWGDGANRGHPTLKNSHGMNKQ